MEFRSSIVAIQERVPAVSANFIATVAKTKCTRTAFCVPWQSVISSSSKVFVGACVAHVDHWQCSRVRVAAVGVPADPQTRRVNFSVASITAVCGNVTGNFRKGQVGN